MHVHIMTCLCAQLIGHFDFECNCTYCTMSSCNFVCYILLCVCVPSSRDHLVLNQKMYLRVAVLLASVRSKHATMHFFNFSF